MTLLLSLFASPLALAGEVEIRTEPGAALVSYEGKPAAEATDPIHAFGTYTGPLPDGLWRVGQVAFVVGPEPVRVDTLSPRCSGGVSAFDLMVPLEAAEGAFGAGRLPEFLIQSQVARDKLPCVNEAISAPLAARVHRVQALRGFVDRDEGALSSLSAARALEPGYVFPSTIVPDGHPLHDRLATAPTEGPTRALPKLAPDRVQVDGREAEVYPTSRAVVLQHFAGSGSVSATGYLLPEAPLPPWLPAGAPPPPPPRAPVPKEAKAFAGGAVGSAVLGAGLYAAALASQRTYNDDDTDPSRLEGLRSRTNGLATAGVVGGGLAVGLGLGAAFTWSR